MDSRPADTTPTDAPAPVRTRVSDLLGIDYPIVQAPMGWIARSQLASAVSRAGGGLPGKGFFDLARELGCGPRPGETDRAFHDRQIAQLARGPGAGPDTKPDTKPGTEPGKGNP